MSEVMRLTPADINRMLLARSKNAPRLKFDTMADYEKWKAENSP